MTAEDINIGWGAILETFEMRLAELDHVFSSILNPVQHLWFRSHQGI
jgi:hypothetical protein